MGVVNKIDYLLAILKNKSLELQFDQIELDDKEIIRLGLDTTDILEVNIDHIEWQITDPLETYEGTKVKLPKINVYWDDGTITEETINYTMIDNVSYYLEAGNYELKAVYNNFTSTNTLPITVIKKELISIEWENTNSITTQQNHRAYLPYIKLNYNDGNSKRISAQSPGIILNDSEYYLELGEHILTATYKEFTTNELIINVVEEIIDEDTHDYSQDYLTFEALEDGYFKTTKLELEYSIDNGVSWKFLNIGQNSELILANTNVLFKRNKIEDNGDRYSHQILFSGKCNVFGNLCSINGMSKNIGRGAFCGLFENNKIIHSSNLILPNVSNDASYIGMFSECKLMIDTPNLSNIQYLSHICFGGMFKGCSSLIIAPELPWIDLADACYMNMFNRCSSLKTAPELPAEILKPHCYGAMFKYCSSLINAPELNSMYLSDGCYDNMFCGCTSLIKAPELPATQLANLCYSHMFANCVSLLNVPELPAQILSQACYANMFNGCISINNVPNLIANILADYCYVGMFQGCTNISYVEIYATCVQPNYFINNYQSISYNGSLSGSSKYYFNFLEGTSNNGIFKKIKDVEYPSNLTYYGSDKIYNIIPKGWTVQEIDPDTGEIVNEYINE